MATVYSDAQFRTIFQTPFNLAVWTDILRVFFKAKELKVTPEAVATTDETTTGYYLGNIDTKDSYRIGLFHYEIKRGSVANKLVGLRNLVRSFINPNWGEFDAALVTFDSGDHWRLSFISDIKGEETHPKRYSYVFGNPELRYSTPLQRFELLNQEGISFLALRKAFSVEALSDKFFDAYREHYADFVQYVTGKRFVKVGNKWEEQVDTSRQNDVRLYQAFGYDDKRVRDYVKKMMGRITFLHFLQRKGWMNGDLNYMQHLFERSTQKDNFLDAVLEPLFFGILNTKPELRQKLFEENNWDLSLLEEWRDIPYLNGGLFEQDEEDEPESIFPAELFNKLFNFFGEYNFTIDENDPSDAEIGVDPEMLGKIFENLLEDNKDKGAFYTPKEIVQYMCRESLISYLHKATEFSLNNIRTFVLTPEDGLSNFTPLQKEKLASSLLRVKVCDPAIGSGAFPMSLLNELLRCREALSVTLQSRAELKKDIIANNIYGVDIEKGAVDIARLRFWLSIVVEADSPSPLPNLDYKIMQGDSLRESYMGCDLSRLGQKQGRKSSRQRSLALATEAIQTEFVFDESGAQKNIQELIRAYFNINSHREKEKIRFAITSTIREYIRFSGEGTAQDIQESLTTIDIPNNQFFLWHTFFGDVLSKSKNSGFDIIIGNPPYGANIDALREVYQRLYPATSKGYKEIYKYFFDQSLRLCKDKGILCFITPDTFIHQPRYADLRQLISGNKIMQIIDLGEKVFEEAVVPVAITLLQKTQQKSEDTVLFADVRMCDHASILSKLPFEKKKGDFLINSSVLTDSLSQNLKTIELGNILSMKDAGINYQRVGTGMAEKGKSDLSKRLMYQGDKESEKDMEFWKGEDINTFWKAENTQRFCRTKIELKTNERVILNSDYFSIAPKLLWRQTANRPICTVDYEGKWFGRSIQAGIIKKEYLESFSYLFLCGILNSDVIASLYNKLVSENGRTYPQIKLQYLKKLPIIIPSEEQKNKVEAIVKEIIYTKQKGENASTLEDELNAIVSMLYQTNQ